jgi:transposase
MNPFPAERSVLVLDNCRIHHNKELYDLVHDAGMLLLDMENDRDSNFHQGCLLLYLLPYSPDLNPIEESFSARMLFAAC